MSAPFWVGDISVCQAARNNIQPKWHDGLPICVDSCPRHDGKRCELTGARPCIICEVAVKRMAKRLDSLQGG